jgi:Holliday junction resolvasome RuvABC ATP-dependent DNA helicase subunit
MSDDQRLVDSNSDDFERAQELALRPKTLQEFVGQNELQIN